MLLGRNDARAGGTLTSGPGEGCDDESSLCCSMGPKSVHPHRYFRESDSPTLHSVLPPSSPNCQKHHNYHWSDYFFLFLLFAYIATSWAHSPWMNSRVFPPEPSTTSLFSNDSFSPKGWKGRFSLDPWLLSLSSPPKDGLAQWFHHDYTMIPITDNF